MSQPAATSGNNQMLITLQMQANQSLQQLQSIMSSLINAFNNLTRALFENVRAMMKIAAFPTQFAKMMKPNVSPFLGPKGGGKGSLPSEAALDTFDAIDQQINSMATSLQNVINPKAAPKTKDKSGGLGIMGEMTKSMGNFFSMMGPQMVALSIVTEPLSAFLEAFLEPLGMLSDYFGAFGGILSQLLLPIMMALQPVLDALIPLFQGLVTSLTPLITDLVNSGVLTILVQILQAIIPHFVNLVGVFSSLLQLITPFLPIAMELISVILTPLLNAITFVSDALGTLVGWLTSIKTSIDDFVGGIINMFENLKKFDWNEIGRIVTGGGSDNYGWW